MAASQAKGIIVHFMECEAEVWLKELITRDPFIMVKGGAIVCLMEARIRRGEELAVTGTLANLGVPILRTINGTGVMEGGSFAG